jgi:heme-degrading monooxygenase HmoA
MREERAVHVLIWEFHVRAGCEADFEEAYGPGGDWARLFDSAPGYLGTELVRDPEDGRRYLTIDRWASAEAFSRFRESRASEYEALDARCSRWTEDETPLGAWRVVRG